MPTVFLYAVIAVAVALRLPAVAQWTPCSTGSDADLRSVVFTSPEVGVAVGSRGTILRTTTGGATWSAVRSGTPAAMKAVTHAPGGALYAVGHFGVILKSTNQGSTWVQLASGTGQDLLSVHFPSASTGYAVGAGGTILRTANRGRTWQHQHSTVTSTLGGVFFPIPRVGYIVQPGGARYLKTVDRGITWTEGTLPTGAGTLLSGQLVFRDANNGLLLGASHPPGSDEQFTVVYATADGGTTWVPRRVPESTGLLGSAVAIHFTSPVTGYLLIYRAKRMLIDGYSGDDGYAPPSATLLQENMVLQTTDAGATWKPHSTIVQHPFRVLYDVAFPTPASGVVVGEQGHVHRYP